MQEKWHEFAEWGYRLLYVIGMQTVRLLHHCAVRLAAYFRPVRYGLRKAVDWLLLRHVRAVVTEFVCAGRGFASVPAFVREHGVAASVLFLPVKAVHRHAKALKTLFNWAAPVLGVILLAACLNHYLGLHFALEVTYRGQSIGFIANEVTYDDAAQQAADRVVNADDSFTVDRTPSLTLAVVDKEQPLLDKNALCDNILSTAGSSIAQMGGLYIDGKFEGALTSSAAIQAVLDAIQAPYLSGSADERAEFVQNVQIVDGLYPVSSAVKMSELTARLTAQSIVANYYTVQKGDNLSKIARMHNMTVTELRAMNPEVEKDTVYVGQQLLVQRPQPYLQVQVVRQVKVTEVIPYQTKKAYNSKKDVTWEKLKQKGQNGSRDIVYEVTLLDGIEASRVVVSNTVTKQPVDRIVEYGTVPLPGSEGKPGDGIVTGSMLWPVPICTNMSRGWSNGHQALDIANGPVTVNKKPFYAADGGVVKYVNKAGWGGGYGLFIQIDHGNGLETLYAHCSAVYVEKGQKVSRGQLLGLIGNTGNSFGPHLHFEVRKNGRRVNPLNYVKPSKW